MSYHFIPIRITVIFKMHTHGRERASVGKVVQDLKHLRTVGRNVNYAAGRAVGPCHVLAQNYQAIPPFHFWVYPAKK